MESASLVSPALAGRFFTAVPPGKPLKPGLTDFKACVLITRLLLLLLSRFSRVRPCATPEMAAHASVLAWRVPGTGEPGGLPSVGPHRVGHDGSDSAAAELSISDTFASDVQDVGSVRHRHVSILLSVLLPM